MRLTKEQWAKVTSTPGWDEFMAKYEPDPEVDAIYEHQHNESLIEFARQIIYEYGDSDRAYAKVYQELKRRVKVSKINLPSYKECLRVVMVQWTVNRIEDNFEICQAAFYTLWEVFDFIKEGPEIIEEGPPPTLLPIRSAK